MKHGRSQDFFLGGTLFQKNFQKIFKKFSKNFRIFLKIFESKLRKCIILAYFSQNLRNHALIFCALDEKENLLDILRKCSKILKIFLRKIAKNALF